MREIKFRAWDKVTRQMGYPSTCLSMEISFSVGSHLIRVVPFDDICFEPYGRTAREALCNSRYEVMQFTGLHDKNGKEICEGDILRITCGCAHQENLSVEWQDGHNGYFARTQWQHDWDNDQLELRWTERDAEVIGNIYENPELLK